MAELIDANDIMFTPYEPKVKNRFIMQIDGIPAYSEFQQIFGDSFKSGSQYYQYLTSHTAENYLKHSDKLTVVRILDGNFSTATATSSYVQSM